MTPSNQQESILTNLRDNASNTGIVARAGCGKTTTIIQAANVVQGKVFIGAFNKSIAEELATRSLREGVRTATLHSEGFALWRRVAPKVKVDSNKVSKIIEELFSESVRESAEGAIGRLVSMAKQHVIDPTSSKAQRAMQQLIDHHDMDCALSDNDLIDAATQTLLASTHKDGSVVDFDDMIYAPTLRDVRGRKYDWVMIDEAQDTNPARRELALSLATKVVYVGDDRQAIYGFTGADASAMLELQDLTGAKEFPLNETYRCASAIVDEARRYVPDISAAPSNSKGMVERLKLDATDSIQFNPSDAILCRNTRPLVAVAYRLIKQRIPCYIEGRDIGAGLRKLAQRFRVKNLSILSSHLDDYLETEYAKNADKPWKVAALSDKVETLQVLIGIAAQELNNNIDSLLQLIDTLFGQQTLGARVILSTIHRAKGREWDRVFLLNQEQLIPSKFATKPWMFEQEQNLAYVAITRAKNHLVYLEVPGV